MTATPAKLRNGTWGARVQGSVAAGDTVTIRTKAGKTWSATVAQVIWSGDGVTLCATQSSAPRRAPRMGSGHGAAAPVPGYASYCTDRHDCRCYDCI